MKKLLLAVLLFPLALTANADPITREQAQQKAERHLQGKPGSRKLSPVVSSRKLSPRRGAAATSPETYYAFNRGEGDGFVLVAADDRISPVLGYTDDGEFDYNTIPDNMRTWLDAQERYVRYLQEHPDYATAAVPVHDAIPEMLTTRWNQGAPYNDLTPRKSNGNATVTGCVATAMAQVLYYQHSKSVDELQATIPGYTTWTQKLEVESIPQGSPIDWKNMLNTYGSNASAVQKKAVAQLMKYCGAAVHMDYDDSSGAQPGEVPGAINTYFGYTTARIVWQSDFNEVSWDALLYNELANGRVAYLGGYNPNAGHAFVCDGYDGNHCFHINWGWGGSSNGYFLLTALTPGQQGIGGSEDGSGFTDNQNAVIGCEPTDYHNKALPITNSTVKKACLANFDTDGDGVFTYGEAAAVTDLGDAFKGQRFTSFTELYYFTSLTTVTEGAFEGCTSLTTVKLPKHLKAIGARAFQGCTALKTFVLPEGLTTIEDGAFDGCKAFTFTLPSSIQSIGAEAFSGCVAQTSVELPIGLASLGTGAFKGCTKLNTVILRSISPQRIQLGADVFADIDLSAVTLKVVQGNKAAISAAAQWKDFGHIVEMRDLSNGQFVQPTTGKKYYIYNVGTGRYLTHGEAYDTQAIVDLTDEPMRFELRKTTAMPDGVYYLYSADTGNSNHILFRTSSDGYVGSGVHACFVDGPTSKNTDKSSWWNLAPVEGEDNVYTLQVPSSLSDYNADQYLGVDPNHDSNYKSPTYGIYSDILLEDFTPNCHWMFAEYDEDAAASYQFSLKLRNLLNIAGKKNIDATREQAVYDDLTSTHDDIDKAQRSLRRKLGFIQFSTPLIHSIVLEQGIDRDGDGEITTDEAVTLKAFDTAAFQQNKEITALPDLEHFTQLEEVSVNAFKNCSNLTSVTLPDNIYNVYSGAFQGCSKLTAIVLPSKVEFIGNTAFGSCSSLKEVTVGARNPSSIELGKNIFTGVSLADATLYVPAGSADAYREAPVWKDFGTIKEVRAFELADFAEPTENEDVYVYNVGMRRYIINGEAYGTQAVVGTQGFIYQLRRTKSMPEDTYYLYATNYGGEKKVLFRTSSDKEVGEGVKTCFIDGAAGATAYWKLTPVEGKTNVYTLQVPENQADYTEGEFLGIDTSHESKTANPTSGLYWDIPYDGNELNCQWAFIRKVDADTLSMNYYLDKGLAQLLQTAKSQGIDVTEEQAVYEDLTATRDQLLEARSSVRKKLHYIDFADWNVQNLVYKAWDENFDNELTYEEAAAVTDLGTTFRSASTITSFEELRYFTGLKEIPDDAFRACSKLFSIYLPANITAIGKNAFTNCTALRYAAILTPTMLDATESGITTRNLTLFVPQALVATYQEDENWGRGTVKEYTGTPTIQVEDASREYGRTNPKFNFDVTGAPINNTPELTADADATTPVGNVPITVVTNTVTSEGLKCVNGTLTITPAEITVTAKSYSRNVGEANPEFEASFSSFRNREKAEEVLLHEPVLECDATPDSPAGTYEIRVSGAEAQNYVFTYVPGTLTVIDPDGVRTIHNPEPTTHLIDLSGRRMKQSAKPGLYITNGKKTIVK